MCSLRVPTRDMVLTSQIEPFRLERQTITEAMRDLKQRVARMIKYENM